ncbi:MAG: T9SS type A sorting domain-containing protein [Rhodothermales bacterium]
MPTQAVGQTVEPMWDDQFSAYGVDGEVLSAAVDANGDLIVVGEFSRAGGLAADGIAKWNGSQWSTLGGSLGRGFSGVVHAVAIAPDGSIYIGGDFFEVVQGNGSVVDVENLAKWNGATWEPLGTGVDAPVHALAIDQSGLLYIGGEFARDGSGEFELSKIATWDGSNLGSVGNGLGTFSGVIVRSLGFDSLGDLYAAGSELSGGVFKWDGQSWETIGARHQGTVNTIAFDASDNLYIGGDFQTVIQTDESEITANRIARWDGTTWEGLGSGFDGEVRAMGFDNNGTLYVSGLFAKLGDGTALRHIARWNTTWEAIGPGEDENLFESVNALAFTGDGAFYALGDVQHLGGELVNGIGYWDGQKWNGIGGMGLDAAVHALTFDSSGILYAGGEFVYSGPFHSNKITRWVDNAWQPLGQGVTGASVQALAQGANRMVYVGGDFSDVIQDDGTTLLAYNIAAWDGAVWSTLGTGVNGAVKAIVVDASGNLFIGGTFTQDGSEQETRNYIAMWNGSAWSTPGGGFDGPVHALALNNEGQVIAGGSFTQAGIAANTAYIAEWNGTSWEPLSATTVLDAEVNALYVNDAGVLYAGGAFTETEAGFSTNYIASFESGVWAPLGSSNGNGLSACCVNAISQSTGGDIIVGGDFEGVQNPVGPDLQVGNAAIWRELGGWALLSSGMDDEVFALASNGEDVMVGGQFQVAGDLPSAFIARWSTNEMLVSVEDGFDLPATLTISDIYPNPATSIANFTMEVSTAQQVDVEMYDVLGRSVKRVFSGFLGANQQTSIAIDRAGLSAGMYFVRVKGDAFIDTRSVVWVR